ncbi:MAG: hypothetical protein IKE22_09860 [Atopobiaceae bacterium]|nr:hypothetical protein [Atopobiaceae bacterium]
MRKETETGLILPVGSPSAKAIMLLRKLTPLSIAEIRQRAAEGRPITGFEDRDEYGIRDDEVLLRSVRRASKELLSLGVDARIVIDGREEGASYLDNVIQGMRETAEQLDWEDEVGFAQEEVERAIDELAGEFEDFCWWVPDDLYELGEELERELPAGHPLEGRDLAALARSERRDDVLFHDGQGYILAHLTWSAHNALPFPLFEVVNDDIPQFLRDDHLEGSGD